MYQLDVNCGLGDTTFVCESSEALFNLISELPYPVKSYFIHPVFPVIDVTACKYIHSVYDPPSGFGQFRCRLNGDVCRFFYRLTNKCLSYVKSVY